MSSVQTSIQLQDNFTNVILGIINSVNLAVSAMDDMGSAMSGDIDTASLQAARDQINQANAAAIQLNETLDSMVQQPAVNQNGNTMPFPVGAPGTGAPANAPPVIQPNPVTIPVVWETDNLDVFTNTGVERFEQEAQSANAMLERLGSTQDDIARQVFHTSVLPPQAFQDLSSMAQRIDVVRERIQQIENNPINIGTDMANAELEQLRGYLGQALDAQGALNTAMQNMDVGAVNESYFRLSQTVGNTERYLRDNVDEQGRFNQEIQEGANQANALTRTIMGAVSAYAGIQSVKNILDASDELTLTTSRLDLMNDGVQSTGDLVNMVYVAAQDARGSFSDMADVVARFGNNAKDAFSSSAEVVRFAGLIQKQMAIAGASTDEAANAQLQLSQALGSGVLRGDELNSIFEQAPNLIQNIADYLDVPIGKIREMAADGELSADTVKQSIFAATDQINENFNNMPMTWGQVWQSMQNTALIAFQPVLEQLNEFANSEGFQSFVNVAIEGMAILSSVTLDVFSLVGSAGSFIADNWSIISPFIYGAAAALAVYYGWQFAVNAINMISNGIHVAMAIAQMMHAAATGGLTAATAAEIAAQNGLNAAMFACPITWIIIMVIALIAIFYAAVAAVNKFAGTTVSATGIICGVIATAAAVIANIFIGLVNTVIGIGVEVYNLIASFANFFANVFNDPVGAIIRLFADLFDFIAGIVQSAARLIDTVLGSNLSGHQ